jgi:hypothetical protein
MLFAQNETNTTEIIFHYMKHIWVHNTAPLTEVMATSANVAGNNNNAWKGIPTYKKVLMIIVPRVWNLRAIFLLQSVWAWPSHFDYFKRILPGWEKLVPVFSHLDHS